jgi:hypothetical protein
MSDASYQRSEILQAPSRAGAPRPWPLGYGLLIGAAASVALWGAFFWGVGRLVIR